MNRDLNENLLEELEKQFPKGDKARGKALVLHALAEIEINKAFDRGKAHQRRAVLGLINSCRCICFYCIDDKDKKDHIGNPQEIDIIELKQKIQELKL